MPKAMMNVYISLRAAEVLERADTLVLAVGGVTLGALEGYFEGTVVGVKVGESVGENVNAVPVT